MGGGACRIMGYTVKFSIEDERVYGLEMLFNVRRKSFPKPVKMLVENQVNKLGGSARIHTL